MEFDSTLQCIGDPLIKIVLSLEDKSSWNPSHLDFSKESWS